jgi:hypothetical protein
MLIGIKRSLHLYEHGYHAKEYARYAHKRAHLLRGCRNAPMSIDELTWINFGLGHTEHASSDVFHL